MSQFTVKGGTKHSKITRPVQEHRNKAHGSYQEDYIDKDLAQNKGLYSPGG